MGQPSRWSRRWDPLCHATVHPIRIRAAKSLFAFTDVQRLMRRRRPSPTAVGRPLHDRCSRRRPAEPTREPPPLPLHGSVRGPSPRAWIRYRPTNGRHLPVPGRWESILARVFPSVVRSPSPHFSCAVKRRWSTVGKVPPGNWFAPPGSNRSSSGGNEAAEASGVEGRLGDLASL